MELDKLKRLFLNFIVDFLIADYLSWEFLKSFNINLQELVHRSLEPNKKHISKKRIKYK